MMSGKMRGVSGLVVLATLALASALAPGAETVLPSPFATAEGNDNLTTPFRNAPRVLQMYFHRSDLAAFSAQGADITGIQFRIDGASPGVSGATWPTADINFSRYDVQLSDSSAAAFAADELNSTTFTDNQGSDITLVRSGPLTVTANSFQNNGDATTGASFGFLVNFDVPFRYEPGEDLMVTIRHSGFTEPEAQPNFDAAAFTDGRNDALAGTGSADATTGAFFGTNITQFTFTPIPEPAALGLIAAAAPLLGRRRKR